MESCHKAAITETGCFAVAGTGVHATDLACGGADIPAGMPTVPRAPCPSVEHHTRHMAQLQVCEAPVRFPKTLQPVEELRGKLSPVEDRMGF